MSSGIAQVADINMAKKNIQMKNTHCLISREFRSTEDIPSVAG